MNALNWFTTSRFYVLKKTKISQQFATKDNANNLSKIKIFDLYLEQYEMIAYPPPTLESELYCLRKC